MRFRLIILVYTVLLHAAVFAQQDTAIQTPTPDSSKRHYDSATNKLFSTVKQFGEDIKNRNLAEYREDTIATRQDEIIAEIRKLTIEAKSYLENGLDTTGLTKELRQIDDWYAIAGDGVFTNIGNLQTHRNLETSYTIMNELLTRVLRRKFSLDGHYKKFILLRNKLDSLYKADILYQFSSDSALLMRYVKKLVVIADEIKPIDSAYKQALIVVSELQTTVNRFVNKVNLSLSQLEIFQDQVYSRTFGRETFNLGGAVTNSRPFSTIVDVSLYKGMLAFGFYVQNEAGRIALLFLLVLATTLLLVNLRGNLRSKNLLDETAPEQRVLKYPALSATVIVLNILQFIFPNPPFVFNIVLWVVSAIFLTILFRRSPSEDWKSAWIILFIFFLLAAADNLILQASRPERWLMLALSIAGILCCSIMLLRWCKKRSGGKWMVYFTVFVLVMQLVSILANSYGRYNLSKTCLTNGFFNIVIAILFLWALRFIHSILSLAAKAYDIGDRKLFYINVNRLGSKPRPIFYVLLAIGWLVLFSRNLFMYKMIADPITDFIEQKRTIGEFSITIGTVILFFLIIYLSALISSIVSFFTFDRYSDSISHRQRKGVGSWLLIIRIFIITTGLLLAFATIGIPMDRLTIILSALGVGIGFGLQTLVNNLVSGLIISFEKPVNVGDFVEIGGRAGNVRSIGFRSSILSIGNGSQVVIPNGDLLNQHVVNWTQNNASRSVDIPVSVAFGTDLGKAIQLLSGLPVNDERTLTRPGPAVIIKQFSSSGIDMQLSFWVRDMGEMGAVRTDIIVAIQAVFKENHIEIPFPQQDLHIRSVTREKAEGDDEIPDTGR